MSPAHGCRRCGGRVRAAAPPGWGVRCHGGCACNVRAVRSLGSEVAVRATGGRGETRLHETPALPPIVGVRFGGGYAVPTKASGHRMSQLLARVGAHACPRIGSAASRRRRRARAAGPGGGAGRRRRPTTTRCPGAESQQAIDLFQAHSPAFGGADSTLVFTVDDGKVSDPGAQGGDRGRARRRSASSTASSSRRARSSRAARSPRTGGWRRSTCATRRTPAQIDKADGEALIAAGETAEPEVQVEARGVLIDLATEQTLPVGELIGVLIAIVLLTLLFRSGGGDGRDADRRAGRRRGRADPAGRRCRRRSACPRSRR